MSEHPFRDAIEVLVGPLPLLTGKGNYPLRETLDRVYSSGELSDADYSRLHDYCSGHRNPAWATGTSMIEAADLIVAQAVENANIKPQQR